MQRFEMGILYFFFYSVLGWVYETILCSVRERKFVNRGFLYGPYCPIYGFGALLVILVLGRVENPIVLFFASTILTCSLEYATSWVMEELFHARWWDYSNRKFNINGRICLLGAVAFGTFSVVLLKYLHPAVSAYIEQLSQETITILSFSLFVFMLADTVVTISKFWEFDDIMRETSEFVDEGVSSMMMFYDKANDSYRGTLNRINSQIRRMVSSFPKLRPSRPNEVVKKLRALMHKESNGDDHS